MVYREDIEWLRELPYTISLPAHRAMVVHAGRIPGVALEAQAPWDFVNMRNVISSPTTASGSKKYVAIDRAKEGEAWASVWQDELCHVYFGHDAKRGLQLYPHATGIDTGACYGMFISYQY